MTEELLLDTPKELKAGKHDEVIYKGLAKIKEKVPSEYVNSAMFSLLIDAIEKNGKIFLITDEETHKKIFTQFKVK